jgi:hypothetical protein
MTGLKDSVHASLDCKAYSPSNSDHSEQQVLLWRKDFVVIAGRSYGYCGGAHGYFDHGATIYDTQTGEPEKIDTWFKEYLIEYAEDGSLKPFPAQKLMKAVTKQYLLQREGVVTDSGMKAQECLESESVHFSNAYAWPTEKGMVFQGIPDRHIVSACGEDVLVPYSVVMPYLSAHGKARVISIGIK